MNQHRISLKRSVDISTQQSYGMAICSCGWRGPRRDMIGAWRDAGARASAEARQDGAVHLESVKPEALPAVDSRRDYFAAHAPEVPDWFMPEHASSMEQSHYEMARIVAWRYAYADAMLANRE